MAEAMLTVLDKGRFSAYSAGTRAGGLINPFALEEIRKIGYPVESLYNKSWNEFIKPDAQAMDFVITVCEQAAHEFPPIWPGDPICANWFFEPPLATVGTTEVKRRVFQRITRHIQLRIQAFVALHHETLDRQSLQQEINAIGRMAA
jgi:arsenate reductase